jgi:hypothetical protein
MSFLRRFAPPQVLLAAAIPFLGYTLAFVYERGYTGRYGIPTWMTRVTLMQAVIASAAAALLVAGTPVVARGLSRVASQWVARVVLAPAAAIAVALWAYSETQWVMGAHLVIPSVLIAVFGGYAALRIHRTVIAPVLQQGGSWVDRVKDNAMSQEPRSIAALAWMGHRVRWTLAVVVVALFGAYWIGNYQSRKERRFLVASSAPTCIAVRKSSDGIICAITDLTARRVLPRLRVLPPQAKENLTVAILSPLRSPFDADRKLFTRPRTGRTTGTVYSPREEAPVTQAGRPAATAKKPTTTAKRPTTTARKGTTTKRTATTKRATTTRTSTTRR